MGHITKRRTHMGEIGKGSLNVADVLPVEE
jgi:hypothetical protein